MPQHIELCASVSTMFNESTETYGSPRVLREVRKSGVRVGKRRVERRDAQERARCTGIVGARETSLMGQVLTYNEVFFNRRRFHSSLDYTTPAEVEHETSAPRKAC